MTKRYIIEKNLYYKIEKTIIIKINDKNDIFYNPKIMIFSSKI